MAKEKNLVCDVDGVVVDLSYEWFKYLRAMIKDAAFTYQDVARFYNFQEPLKQYITQEEAFHFWKKSGLYDGREPIIGAREALWRLKNECGFSIVFASHVEGNHAKSKFEFLKRNFPVDGFMATREKQFVRATVAIDDRIEHLMNHPSDVVTVLKFTPQEQTCLTDFTPTFNMYEWSDAVVDRIVQEVEKKHAQCD